MLRPTTRVCHARQNVTVAPPLALERPARFEKNPGRWLLPPSFYGACTGNSMIKSRHFPGA